MNLMIFIIGNIIVCFLIFFITKDFLHPGFLFCVPWIVFSILLLFGDLDYDSSSFCYIYFLTGTILFEMGCLLGHKKIINKERLINTGNHFYYVNYQMLKTFLIVEGVFIILVLLNYIFFIRSHFNVNIFLSLHSRREMSYIGLIGYARNIFSAFGICMIIVYPHICPQERPKYKKYMLFQILMYLPLTLTGIERTAILCAALPIFIACIIVTKQKNSQVFKKILIAFLLFLFLFAIITVMKYYTMFSNGEYLNNIFNQIVLYGSGGSVAFQKRFDNMYFLNYGGANTFRFFYAFFDKIAGTNHAVPTILNFSSIGANKITNVYTFYQWYADDFGVIYALFIQFIIGILHGISYKKMSQMKSYGIYAYCLLLYPLIMQFFQDQYFTLTSTWLQYFITGFIFLNTDILFSRTAWKKGIHIYLTDQ